MNYKKRRGYGGAMVRIFSFALALLLILPPECPAQPHSPDPDASRFSSVDDCLILTRETSAFDIENSFCETVYMPSRELDYGEEHRIALTPFYGGGAPLMVSEIIRGGNFDAVEAERRGGAFVFKLKNQPKRSLAPADYSIVIRELKSSKIHKIIKGSIFPAHKKCAVSLLFPMNEDLAAAPDYEVYIAGDMNGWDPKASKLSFDKTANAYRADFNPINKGRYKYKFVIGGKWVYDRSNPVKEADEFGSFNSIFTAGDAAEADRLIPGRAFGEGRCVRFKIFYDGRSSNPSLAAFYKGLPLEPGCVKYDRASKSFDVVIDERKFAAVDHIKPSLMFYSFTKAEDGVLETVSPEYCFYKIPGLGGASNFRDAVIYFAMTDRFLNGDKTNDRPLGVRGLDPKCDFHGGDIAGILKAARNDYFSGLGVNLLWISPVLKGNGRAFRDSLPPRRKFSNYHGYWPYSLDEAEPRQASFEQLAGAVSELREKYSIEVILDAVFRHVTIDSPVYKNHKDLFLGLYLKDKTKNVRRFDDFPETTWFDDFLPAFDYANTRAVDFMAAKADGWIKNTGVRGFRLDAVKHIPHNFWSALLARRDNFFTVGETIDGREKIASYIGPGMLSSQFDFPLYFAVVDVLAKNGGAGFERLDREIERSEEIFWNSHKLTSNLIGNHDFPRFTAYADGWFDGGAAGDGKELGFTDPPRVRDPRTYDKLSMAFGLIFALNGMPLIYYGDEYGECGAGDPDNRRPMRFNGELNAFEAKNLGLVKKLAAIRKTNPALTEGTRVTLLADETRYAFAKVHFNETLIAAFNKSSKAAVIEIDTGRLGGSASRGGREICFYDLISGEKFVPFKNGKLKIAMKPTSFRYLEILK